MCICFLIFMHMIDMIDIYRVGTFYNRTSIILSISMISAILSYALLVQTIGFSHWSLGNPQKFRTPPSVDRLMRGVRWPSTRWTRAACPYPTFISHGQAALGAHRWPFFGGVPKGVMDRSGWADYNDRSLFSRALESWLGFGESSPNSFMSG